MIFMVAVPLRVGENLLEDCLKGLPHPVFPEPGKSEQRAQQMAEHQRGEKHALDLRFGKKETTTVDGSCMKDLKQSEMGPDGFERPQGELTLPVHVIMTQNHLKFSLNELAVACVNN